MSIYISIQWLLHRYISCDFNNNKLQWRSAFVKFCQSSFHKVDFIDMHIGFMYMLFYSAAILDKVHIAVSDRCTKITEHLNRFS